MHYSSTIFNQLLNFLPKDHFKTFVGQHQADRYTKKLTAWNQLIALLYAQATGKESLREIETGFNTHSEQWYHLGVSSIARSSLAYANNKRAYDIFEKLFYALLAECKKVLPEKQFSFQNPLYSFDSSTIQLCLSLFNWASYRTTKGALKLHTLLNNRTGIPEFLTISDGKKGDITALKEVPLNLEKGSILVFDRAYVDYAFWHQLTSQEIFFVSRIRKSQVIFVTDGQAQDILEKNEEVDAEVVIGDDLNMDKYPQKLRFVKIFDQAKGVFYSYLTNNLTLTKEEIALIYKKRWQIELFFKWIKQNLKIKTFLGTSKNAVLSQIWVAMTYYLLLAYIKFQTKFKRSLLELTRMIRETLMLRRHLIDLLSLSVKTIHHLKPTPNFQTSFW